MALTTGQLATLQTTTHRHTFYLSVSIPRELLTASVSGSLSRGETAIAYSSGTGTGYASIRAGQTLKVVTATGTEYVRIRNSTGSQSSGTITVAANEIVWASGQAITVLEEYRLWPLLPRFTEDGTFYKDQTITYTDQNDAPYPVAIANHRVGWLPSVGTYDYTEDLTGSYGIEPTATISNYSLSLDPSTGVTVTDNLDGTFDVEITNAGQYWQIVTVTDSYGQSQTTVRRIFLHDANDPPYTDIRITTLAGANGRGGWNLHGQIIGDAADSDLPDEALVVLWQTQHLDTTESYPGALNTAGQNILFTGYLRRGTVRYDWDVGEVRFEAVSVSALLREIAMTSISLEAKTNPGVWYEYIRKLTTGRAIHHLLRWHSTMLEIASVYGLTSDADYKRYFAETSAGTLQSMTASLLRQFQAEIVTDKTGRVYFVRDIQLLDDTSRAALSTTFDVGKADLIGSVSIDEREPQGASVFVSGLATGGAGASSAIPYLSKAPGDAYGPTGSRRLDVSNQVLGDQNHANSLSGRVLARERNRYPRISLEFPGGYAPAIDIIGQEWLTIDVAAADNPRGIVWTNQNIVPRSMRLQLDTANGAMSVSLDCEPEAYGAEGQTEIWETDPPNATSITPPDPPIYEDEPVDETDDPPELLQPPVLGDVITWDATNGNYWLQSDGGSDWVAVNGTLTSGALGGCVDPWRATPNGPGSLNPLNTPLWRCKVGAIYRSSDGGQTWVEVTPVDDPPNSWQDSTAPTVAGVTFTHVEPDFETVGTFTAAATWQETDSGTAKWRSWLVQTTDHGTSWTWNTITVVPTSALYEFDFGQGPQGWQPETVIRDTATYTAYHVASGDRSNNCTDLGPGYWRADEVRDPLNRDGNNEARFATFIYINFPQKISVANGDITVNFWINDFSHDTPPPINSYCNVYWDVSDDGVNWTNLRTSDQLFAQSGCKTRTFAGSNPSTNANITDKYLRIRLRHYVWNSSTRPEYIEAALYKVTLENFSTGADQLRVVHATGNYVLGVASDELLLYEVSGGALALVATLGDCTNAQIDAGTFSGASFALLDDTNTVYVYGRFDLTNGDTGLTGIHHVIKSTDGGATWSSVESGWSTDHCGSFIAGYDSGSGARLWAIRNLSAGTCQLYSGIGSLTAIGSAIAAFHVNPGGFHIIDGQTMIVGGDAADTGTIVYESLDGGSTWSDLTSLHPATGNIKKIRYI